jgi:hypothetical protein
MHLPINVKSPNNISKWHMGINLAFKGLMTNFFFQVPPICVGRDIVIGTATGCGLSISRIESQ